jgi:hypothetical protein
MRTLISVSLLLAACSPATGVSTSSSSTAEATPTTTTTVVAGPGTSAATSTTTTTLPDPRIWYLVSVTAALPEGLPDGLETIDGVDAVSTARVGTLNLVTTTDAEGVPVDAAPIGLTIPLEAQAFDPPGRSGFVPLDVEQLLTDLGSGEVILSTSSARLRNVGVGGMLGLEGGEDLAVVAVVADEWVGDAEVVVSAGDAEILGVTNERYSVVRFVGSRTDLERSANALVDASVRVRAEDEVDVFRHADAVASQLAVKLRYGEFAYRPLRGDAIEIDPVWVEANILHEHIPLLGGITCHKDFVAMLREAMTALEAAGQVDVIDPAAYKGCWNPRFIRRRADLSHHAWGAAADINFGNDLDGPGSPTDPRLLEAMAAIDVLSGHAWTDPDPGHFEWFPPEE